MPPLNILIDATFKHSRNVLNAKRKDHESQGKGNKHRIMSMHT
jgi:hypothetical protein